MCIKYSRATQEVSGLCLIRLVLNILPSSLRCAVHAVRFDSWQAFLQQALDVRIASMRHVQHMVGTLGTTLCFNKKKSIRSG